MAKQLVPLASAASDVLAEAGPGRAANAVATDDPAAVAAGDDREWRCFHLHIEQYVIVLILINITDFCAWYMRKHIFISLAGTNCFILEKK